ncbi:MAG: 16S rRNA (adenine(1518)-N(6)/adenine(1519)-N(6))-dimethyltransferase RsmA [candidate division Zixibacteria bacterium]|nr:16S rRNA (adenine(1518)-N(6)/adenine(1519)-N(6))-dimethyltransferase RsmA [candidate division Zixibacteria bacterium]MDH3935959.1 16S rRNA (adenine(1518)-N(6)/adenine(1519)-N(6))-dimethyltransferase RsmA [candidate division Zixibacteria bacterium]MDH4035384.1 16S rRNA (adenine(1518)-N(6)/adenine(1519)-N(6))-dimethyltransferase RsmA [candidate division Zixibacteria bacterium]
MSGYRPKKRLGQNFLISKETIQRIIDLIQPTDAQSIIEIGAGRGALTLPMAQSGAIVTAVEIDRDLIGYLEKLLENYPNSSILNQDFLRLDPTAAKLAPFVLVGNLPYQISSPVIEWVVQNRESVQVAFLMMQKEVAERLASSPGSKDWSPLAIFTQLYFDVETCFTVGPSAFRPAPKVTSAVVRMTPKAADVVADPVPFQRIVRAAFRQRRKLLVNNLLGEVTTGPEFLRSLLLKMNLPVDIRAEQVSTEQFCALADELVSHLTR